MTDHELSNSSLVSGRRNFLKGAAGGLGFIVSSDVFAMTDDESKLIQQSVSEHARPTTHSPEVRNLKRWVPSQTGPYKLSNALDNHYAFAKVQANLVGTDSWLFQYGWVLMCPPGKPAYPLLGRVLLGKVFVTPTNPAWAPEIDEHSYTAWATFTTVYVDPRTFEPVSKVLNPYTGKVIEVPTLNYADRLVYRYKKSIIVPGVDPKFYDQPWDRDGGYSQHFISAGEETSYTVLGAAQLASPQQPRVDVGFWSVKTAELVSPKFPTIDTRRDYSAVMKTTEYAWYGVEKGDEAQLFVHLTGGKTEDIKKIPHIVRTTILDRFPDRFV